MAVSGKQLMLKAVDCFAINELLRFQCRLCVLFVIVLFVNGANNETSKIGSEDEYSKTIATNSVEDDQTSDRTVYTSIGYLSNTETAKENNLISPEFGVVVVKNANDTREKNYCALEFNGKFIPHSRQNASFKILVNKTQKHSAFCNNVPEEQHHNSIILIDHNTSCDLSIQIKNIEKKYNGSSGVIFVVQQNFSVKNVKILKNTTVNKYFLVAFISTSSVNDIFSTSGEKLVLAFSSGNDNPSPFFDYSLCIIWLIAVVTVCIGSCWSGVVRASLYHKKQIECTLKPKTDERAQAESKPSSAEEEPYLNVSPKWVILFVFFMAAMLVALYAFFNYLVYAIIVLFVLASMISSFACFDQLAKIMLPKSWSTTTATICCIKEKTPIYQLLILVISITVPLVWFFLRKEDYSWVLQDILGIMFSINMLRTIRLPSFKICLILLSLLFLYDIFFVFVTPLITPKGESVMVEVATGGGKYDGSGGGGKVGEQLPMVLRVPHMSSINESDPSQVCVRYSRAYSLLGFGDILVPGLLVSYCHAFDIIHSIPGRLYYITSCIFYGVGLIVTFLGLYLMNGIPQPALLYLVPCTVIPITLIALVRKEFKKLWVGPGDGSVVSESAKVTDNNASGADGVNLLINSTPQEQQSENQPMPESS